MIRLSRLILGVGPRDVRSAPGSGSSSFVRQRRREVEMTAAEQARTRDHATDFDMDSPEFNENYDEVLADLLDRCPVAHSTVGRGYYVVNRQADVRRVAQDWKSFSSRDGMYPNRP